MKGDNMDKQWAGYAESQQRIYVGSGAAGVASGGINPAVQPELERVHDRLSTLLSRLWEANERLYCAADRISGDGARETKAERAVGPQRPGILGKIEKTIESMEEAASALEDRASYFSRLG